MASPRPGSVLSLLEEALAAHGTRLRALASRAAAGGDDDLVHDVRVALRRVEALASLFRGVPEKGDGEALRVSARALRRRLSLLRSEEVGRALLASRTDGSDGSVATLVFKDELPSVRVDAREVAKVARAVAGWRRRLASAFDGAFAPRVDGEAVLVARTVRRLRKRVARLAALLPPGRKTLHEARIAAKRVRYALEAVEPLGADPAPLFRLLRSFQDAAGDGHDLVELAARVRAAAAGDPAREIALAPLARAIDVDADHALAAARRRGTALARPIRKLRPALRSPESR